MAPTLAEKIWQPAGMEGMHDIYYGTALPPSQVVRATPRGGTPGAAGIPPGMRTAIVVPTLLTSVEQVKETLANLESQYLANRAAHLHFAILSDWRSRATRACWATVVW